MPKFSSLKSFANHLIFLLILTAAPSYSFATCAQVLSATGSAVYGGALHGYESTLSQQISYLQSALPRLLNGWGYSLLPGAIFIDAENDLKNQPLPRYTRNARGDVVTLKYNPRSVRFYFHDIEGRIKLGSIYLIEQMFLNAENLIPSNSTSRLATELRRGNNIQFSLASSLDSSKFIFELGHGDFHFAEANIDSTLGPSSQQLTDFVSAKLESFLVTHGLELIRDSIDVAYYYDFRVVMRFKDRQGHMVSFLARNAAGDIYSGHAQLWQSHRKHQRISYQRNSTLTIFNEPVINNSFELWLASGYTNHAAGIELSVADFRLDKMK